MIDLTLLICELRTEGDQRGSLQTISRIEEALASWDNDLLRSQLAGLKESHERLEVKQQELLRMAAELDECKHEVDRRKEEFKGLLRALAVEPAIAAVPAKVTAEEPALTDEPRSEPAKLPTEPVNRATSEQPTEKKVHPPLSMTTDVSSNVASNVAPMNVTSNVASTNVASNVATTNVAAQVAMTNVAAQVTA